MIDIRLFQYGEDDRDKNRCDCGKYPYAILEAENVKIGFCEECLKELGNQISGVQTEIEHTCSHCKHFQKDKYDFEVYGGKCLKQWFTSTDKFGNELKLNPDTDHLGTCDNFEKEEKETAHQELKADKTFVFGEECEAYKKSDVDVVLADKDAEIARLHAEIERLK